VKFTPYDTICKNILKPRDCDDTVGKTELITHHRNITAKNPRSKTILCKRDKNLSTLSDLKLNSEDDVEINNFIEMKIKQIIN